MSRERSPDRPPQPPAAPRTAPRAAAPTTFENPNLGPTTKTEILAYVEGKIKAPPHLPQIEGDTLANKADRVLVVHCNYRELYFQHGNAEVTALAKEKLKALFKLATEGVLQAARNRTAAVQEKAPQALILEEGATLKEETKITIIPTGMIEMVKPGDTVKLLDNGRIYKINGEDQVKCEITRQTDPKGPYTGFVKASAFDKAPTPKPLTTEEEAAAAKPAAGAESTGNGKVLEFNEANFEAEVLKSDKPVIVDFYAPWCGPCKTMEPIMTTLAKRHAGNVKIGKINFDENKKLVEKYQVNGIPYLIAFKNGQVVNTMDGAYPENVVEQTLIYNHPGPATGLPSSAGTRVEENKITNYKEALARLYERTGATIEEKDGKLLIKFKDGTTGEIIESAEKNKLTIKLSGKIGVLHLTLEANQPDKLFTFKMSKESGEKIWEFSIDNKDLKISGTVYTKTGQAIPAKNGQELEKLYKEHHPELEAFFQNLVPEKPEKPPAQPAPSAPTQPSTLSPETPAPSPSPDANPDQKIELQLPPDQIAFFGASLIYHYNQYWPEKYKIPTATDERYVKSGKSVFAMKTDMEALLKSGQLNKITCSVILGGINNLSKKETTAEEIIAALDSMVQSLLNKTPPSLAILCTLPPMKGHRPFQSNIEEITAKANKVNAWIKQQAEKFPGKVIVFDLEKMVSDPANPGHMLKKYYNDGLHLSKVGKAEMAAEIYRIIAKSTAPPRAPAAPATPVVAPTPIAEPEPKPALPIAAPAAPSENPTAALQQSIEKVVENMKGTVAVYVFNPDTRECLARLNENKVLPAASLIKVQILFALHEAVKLGIVPKEDFPMLKQWAEKMITISHNESTDEIIKYLGKKNLGMEWINATMQELGFKQTKLTRLFSKEAREEAQKTQEKNWTTAAEMAKAMTMALTLTSPPGWDSALDLMLKSKRGERLGALLPESVQIARKSGELPRHTHNAYIFISGEKRLVTVVMVSDSYDKDLAKTGTAQIGKLAYDTMSRIVHPAKPLAQPALAIPQQPAPAAEPSPEPAETLDANLNEILTSLRFENIAKLDLTKLDQSFNALKQAVESGKLKIEKIIEAIFPQEREKAIAIIYSDRFRQKIVGRITNDIQTDPRSGAYFQKWEKLIAAVNTTGQHRLTHFKIWQKFLETFSTDTNKNKRSFVLKDPKATNIKPDTDLSRSHQEALDIFFKASFIKHEDAFETGPEITAYEGGIVIAAAGDFKYNGTGNETPSGSHKASPQAKAAYAGGGFSTPLSGNGLAILTYSGEVNYYSHLRSIVVKQGQIIEAGQILGKGGNTGVHAISQGKERGKHLHFQMHTINYDANLITAHPPEYIRAKLLEVK